MSDPLPHIYESGLSWKQGASGTATAGSRAPLTVAPPPQWGGTDEHWSPEHLLLAAAASCLMTTFVAVAAKSKLAFSAYEAKATGTLDKTERGIVFTGIRLSVSLRVAAGDEERARRLLDTAKKHCIVANSLNVPVVLEAAVTAA